jgi:hypothetical protein
MNERTLLPVRPCSNLPSSFRTDNVPSIQRKEKERKEKERKGMATPNQGG